MTDQLPRRTKSQRASDKYEVTVLAFEWPGMTLGLRDADRIWDMPLSESTGSRCGVQPGHSANLDPNCHPPLRDIGPTGVCLGAARAVIVCSMEPRRPA